MEPFHLEHAVFLVVVFVWRSPCFVPVEGLVRTGARACAGAGACVSGHRYKVLITATSVPLLRPGFAGMCGPLTVGRHVKSKLALRQRQRRAQSVSGQGRGAGVVCVVRGVYVGEGVGHQHAVPELKVSAAKGEGGRGGRGGSQKSANALLAARNPCLRRDPTNPRCKLLCSAQWNLFSKSASYSHPCLAPCHARLPRNQDDRNTTCGLIGALTRLVFGGSLGASTYALVCGERRAGDASAASTCRPTKRLWARTPRMAWSTQTRPTQGTWSTDGTRSSIMARFSPFPHTAALPGSERVARGGLCGSAGPGPAACSGKSPPDACPSTALACVASGARWGGGASAAGRGA